MLILLRIRQSISKLFQNGYFLDELCDSQLFNVRLVPWSWSVIHSFTIQSVLVTCSLLRYASQGGSSCEII